MPHRDSLQKIIGVYLANVCREPFEYNGITYLPRTLRVSPLIFRGFTCPSKCGGCCPKFSLDYLPNEENKISREPRQVIINGRRHEIYSDFQSNNVGHFCRHLDRQTGRCGVYEHRPFSCDFELIRFLVPRAGPVHLTQKLFGRGWAMHRVDGQKGALCKMLPPSPFSHTEVLRKLVRLQEWANYFAISTCLPEVCSWVSRGPHDTCLLVPA
jgi:hypothetical protein